MLVIVAVVLAFGLASGSPRAKPHTLPGGRIIGGRNASIADYPYQIALLYDSTYMLCGGAILSPSWVITAAHCVDYFESELQVRAGSSLADSDGELVNVAQIISHPDYNATTVDYDIAVLKLSTNITTSNAVPIPLPESDSTIADGATVVVTGWGDIDENGTIPSVLQVVEVTFVSREDCQKAYVNVSITERMLCAGVLGIGGKDACYGDSGGPAVIDGILAGIVSWGSGCGRAQYPGVYTDVRDLRSWIKEITGL
ncbi:hypothetical protein NQ318_000873 [Aromia moschata]|uniref:Peptidase S1 domain-containing protein n=1 Tax=Aromia moschata TaxID=1265417 RepID=A0AAV8ZEZ4_9CUCU|nr:hypothetical protein NQ318_000873 [Aromia moschata]